MKLNNLKISDFLKLVLAETISQYFNLPLKNKKEMLDFIELNKDYKNGLIRKLLIQISNNVFKNPNNTKKFINKNDINNILNIDDNNLYFYLNKKYYHYKIDNQEKFLNILRNILRNYINKYNITIKDKSILIEFIIQLLKENNSNINVLTDIRRTLELDSINELIEQNNTLKVLLLPTKNNEIVFDTDKNLTSVLEKIFKFSNSLEEAEQTLINKCNINENLRKQVMPFEELNVILTYYFSNKENKNFFINEKLKNDIEKEKFQIFLSEKKDRNFLMKEVKKLEQLINEKGFNNILFIGLSKVGKDTITELLENSDKIKSYIDYNQVEKIIFDTIEKSNCFDLDCIKKYIDENQNLSEEVKEGVNLYFSNSGFKKLYQKKIEEKNNNLEQYFNM